MTAAALGTVATIVVPYVISGVASVARDHTTWNALTNTHDATITTAGGIAAGAFNWVGENYVGEAIRKGARFTGECLGKVVAPTVTLSDASMQTAKQAGQVVEQGVNLVGNAVIQHNPENGWKMTALKVGAGLGMIGAGIGCGALAPEIVLGLGAQAGLAYLGNYLMGGKKEEPKKAEAEAEPQPKIVTEDDKQREIFKLKEKLANLEGYKVQQRVTLPEMKESFMWIPV